MTVKLPDDLRTVVTAHPGIAVELVDEQTQMVYVLLPADEFRRLKSIESDDLSDTYAAQVQAAMPAGWNRSIMNDYDDYDAHRTRS